MTVVADRALGRLAGERVFVTGAAGSIGAALVETLERARVAMRATDLGELDVRDRDACLAEFVGATVVFHLAGAKHAPEGELDPWSVLETNAIGTRNVLDAAGARGARGARVVLASTGKAADPETAYGASKLVAERMVLNAGGSVARFFNVRESSGNVFRIWEGLPAGAPLPVAPCSRFFISLADAVALLVWAAVLPAGRYVVDPGPPRSMVDVAAETWPGRPVVPIAARRGDRVVEPLFARSERMLPAGVDGLRRLVSPHDADAVVAPRAVVAA